MTGTKTCGRGHEYPADRYQCLECKRIRERARRRGGALLRVNSDVRAERAKRATELRAQGLSYDDIARELGLSRSYTNALVLDPDGEREKARKLTYRGECTECGGPTFNGGGRLKPTKCKHCAHGIPREPSTLEYTETFRLSDLTLEERAEWGHEACMREKTPEGRLEILAAVVWPTDTRFTVAA